MDLAELLEMVSGPRRDSHAIYDLIFQLAEAHDETLLARLMRAAVFKLFGKQRDKALSSLVSMVRRNASHEIVRMNRVEIMLLTGTVVRALVGADEERAAATTGDETPRSPLTTKNAKKLLEALTAFPECDADRYALEETLLMHHLTSPHPALRSAGLLSLLAMIECEAQTFTSEEENSRAREEGEEEEDGGTRARQARTRLRPMRTEQIKFSLDAALRVDQHFSVTNAARLLCIRHAELGGDEDVAIHFIQCLLTHSTTGDRSVAAKLARVHGVLHYFPTLREEGEADNFARLVRDFPSKAFGHATLHPRTRLRIVAEFVRQGKHLSARRLAFNGRADEEDLARQFEGLAIDAAKADEEEIERRETFLQLPYGVEIHFVDDVNRLLGELRFIERASKTTLGIDVEWRPVPIYGNSTRVVPAAVVQIATPNEVYVIDAIALADPTKRLERARLSEALFMVFSTSTVWSFGVDADIRVLCSTFPDMIPAWGLALKRAVRRVPVQARSDSLRTVAKRWLGKELDKEQQMSDWSRRPLLPEQLEYAALDAYVLVQIAQRMMSMMGMRPVSHYPPVVAAAPVPLTTSTAPTTTSSPPSEVRFFLDERLFKLTKMLRAASVDVIYEGSAMMGERRDNVLHRRMLRAANEGRAFVTDDASLMRRSSTLVFPPGLRIYVLRSSAPEERFREVIREFRIALDSSRILTRCTQCNCTEWWSLTREEARRRRPDLVREFPPRSGEEGVAEETVDEGIDFFQCSSCRLVVWNGDKYSRVMSRMNSLVGSAQESENSEETRDETLSQSRGAHAYNPKKTTAASDVRQQML